MLMWYRVNSLTNTIASDIKLSSATVRSAIKDLRKAKWVLCQDLAQNKMRSSAN